MQSNYSVIFSLKKNYVDQTKTLKRCCKATLNVFKYNLFNNLPILSRVSYQLEFIGHLCKSNYCDVKYLFGE